MTEKEEVISKILELEHKESDDIITILKQVAPGTKLRTALNGIEKMGRGALIAIENEKLKEICEGGFKINCKFTPQRLMELSKMDGAIVLSKDMKKITLANVLLTPTGKIPSDETGTRHKAADRSAKMAETLTIAVSERRHEINIYYKNLKYLLKDTSEILRRTMENLQLLEKQRELFERNVEKLNERELRNDLQLSQACKVIQKGKAIQKILKIIERNLVELGKESEAIKPRVKELISGVERETDLVIKDYTRLNVKKTRSLLDSLSYEELVDESNIISALALNPADKIDKVKGWRILSRTNLQERQISELTKSLDSLGKILYAKKNQHLEVIKDETLVDKFMEDLTRIKAEKYMLTKNF